MKNKEDIVESAAKVLSEMISLSNQDWDYVYFRFCQPDQSYKNCSWSYVIDNKVRLTCLDSDDLEEEYLDTLEGLAESLFNQIEIDNDASPIVLVLEVSIDGKFRTRFEYKDTDALQITRFYIEKPNSYFIDTEVSE